MFEIERARQTDCSNGDARLEQAAAAHLCGAQQIQSRLFRIVFRHLFPPKCRKTIPTAPIKRPSNMAGKSGSSLISAQYDGQMTIGQWASQLWLHVNRAPGPAAKARQGRRLLC